MRSLSPLSRRILKKAGIAAAFFRQLPEIAQQLLPDAAAAEVNAATPAAAAARPPR